MSSIVKPKHSKRVWAKYQNCRPGPGIKYAPGEEVSAPAEPRQLERSMTLEQWNIKFKLSGVK